MWGTPFAVQITDELGKCYLEAKRRIRTARQMEQATLIQ
jgi:hypothetical protein